MLFLTGRTTSPTILALALALVVFGVEPGVGAAQDAPTTKPAPLPSTISPEIEHFVKLSGRDSMPPTPELRPILRPMSGQDVPQLPPALPGPPSPPPTAGGIGPRPAAPSSPLSTIPNLKPAPFAQGDLRFPINLATALRLSDARPLIVAAAQARTWVAEAGLTQAKLLWLPQLNVGFDYVRHDGGGPDFNKGILTSPSVNFFYGGAGLTGMLPITDAVFEPLVARQSLNSRQWDIQASKNDALLQTADAYFSVHQYRGTYASALYVVDQGRDLIRRITVMSRDLVSAYEVDRARNLVADLEQQSVSARQMWRVESARLTRVLRLDPRAVVEPTEKDHLQITLIDPGRELDDLLPVALANRPEVASRRALVAAAGAAIRREKARPFLPIAMLNGYQTPGGMLLQGGIFGIGPNSSLNQWTSRDDVSLQLVWQLESFGLGNMARIKAQRGRESHAIVDLRRAQDMVAEDVNRSIARLQSAAVRVVQADRALRTGIITYNGTIEGLEQTSRFADVLVPISRPQEAVYALQLLKRAFDEYYATVSDYNRSQFELFHAVGYPAGEVARLHVPGDIVPVDTGRPSFLPPVGHGPPPATR